MTPKEKAEKLVDSFLTASFGIIQEYIPVPHPAAKEFAMIAVDEIIKARPTNPTMDGIEQVQGHFTLEAAEALIFWEQVKTEIDKL